MAGGSAATRNPTPDTRHPTPLILHPEPEPSPPAINAKKCGRQPLCTD